MTISVSLVIISGLLFINTFFIVAVLIKAIRVLGEAQKFTEMARLQIVPISHDLTNILSDIRSIVRTVEREMPKVGDSLTAVRDTTRNIKEFESLIQERIERPLLDITAVLSALVKGGSAFWKNLSRR